MPPQRWSHVVLRDRRTDGRTPRHLAGLGPRFSTAETGLKQRKTGHRSEKKQKHGRESEGIFLCSSLGKEGQLNGVACFSFRLLHVSLPNGASFGGSPR